MPREQFATTFCELQQLIHKKGLKPNINTKSEITLYNTNPTDPTSLGSKMKQGIPNIGFTMTKNPAITLNDMLSQRLFDQL